MDQVIVDLIVLGLVFWAGYRIGLRTAVARIVQNIINDPQHLDRAMAVVKQLDSQTDDTETRLIDVEWHDDICYLYDQTTGEFLAQGCTVEAAVDRIPGADQREYTIVENEQSK